MRGVEVVAGPAHGQSIGHQRLIVDDSLGLGVVLAADAGVLVVLGPAQEHGANLLFVLSGQHRIQPVHSQTEALARPSGAIAGGKSRLPNGVGSVDPLGRLIDELHEYLSPRAGVLTPLTFVGVGQGHEPEHHGEVLTQKSGPSTATIPIVEVAAHDFGPHVFGHGQERTAKQHVVVALTKPTELVGGDPQPGVFARPGAARCSHFPRHVTFGARRPRTGDARPGIRRAAATGDGQQAGEEPSAPQTPSQPAHPLMVAHSP